MKQELFQELEIPEKIDVGQEGNLIKIKGPAGENERKFNFRDLEFEIKGKKLRIGTKKATKKEKKRINSTIAHIRNMISGAESKYEYKLKVCFVHFPSTVEVKGNEVIIKNFLGEKVPRKAKIPKGAEVKVEKELITVRSSDKEIAGQAAANLELSTKIRKRDRRVFQDGIFITSKCGVDI